MIAFIGLPWPKKIPGINVDICAPPLSFDTVFAQEASQLFLDACVITWATERPRAMHDIFLHGLRQLAPLVQQGGTQTRKDAPFRLVNRVGSTCRDKSAALAFPARQRSRSHLGIKQSWVVRHDFHTLITRHVQIESPHNRMVCGARAASLLIGAFSATFQRDSKGVLAYSTISHLGLITLLLGMNSDLALVAAVFHMVSA